MELLCTMQPSRFAVQVPKNVLPIKALSIAMFNGNSNEVKSTERGNEMKKARKKRASLQHNGCIHNQSFDIWLR